MDPPQRRPRYHHSGKEGRSKVRILVTGAAGFIGRHLCRRLAEHGHTVLGVTRGDTPPIEGVELRVTGDIGPHTDWSEHVAGVEVIVHLANRAHRATVDRAAALEPAAAAALVSAAARAGVRRFLHMSSIRAMGEATAPGRPFRGDDPPRPRDPYGRGKLATEEAVSRTARDQGLEHVVLRPPLVYGPGVGANFRALVRLVASGLPLPFAGIDNRRSLIFIDNLVDLAARACVEPAAGHVLLARDAAELATPELLRALAEGLGRPARLYAAPDAVFRVARVLPAIGPRIARLTLSLQVDDGPTRAALGWRPAIDAAEALALTAASFRRPR
jgi:nucleoside-diphosphate-sugar epimerase